MFKHIDILLDGPICSCREMNLKWDLVISRRKKCSLKIICANCGTFLLVPPEKFLAYFILDVKYPGIDEPKVKEPQGEKKSSDGKLLDFEKCAKYRDKNKE